MRTKPVSGLTALVTGASSGIGRELARLMAGSGWNLVLVARNGKALGELAAELSAEHSVKCVVIPADLADEASPQRIYDRVRESGVSVDALVNNVGFGYYGGFNDHDVGRENEGRE